MSDQLANDLATIVELFKSGGWEHLRVEGEGLSLLLSNDPMAGTDTFGSPAPASVTQPAPAAPAIELPASVASKPAPATRDPRWQVIAAPNLGTFYRSPKPGAAAFVEVGATVTADTEICLLEVMKLFTSVKAGVAGVIREIAATDAQLVEGGQPLFYIEPQEA